MLGKKEICKQMCERVGLNFSIFVDSDIVNTGSFMLRAYDAVILKAQDVATDAPPTTPTTPTTSAQTTEESTTEGSSSLTISFVLLVSSFFLYRLF